GRDAALRGRMPAAQGRGSLGRPRARAAVLEAARGTRIRAHMTLDLQPTLRGALVTLEPLRPEHLEELYAVASDPLIWEQHPMHDRWKRGVFEKFFEGA